MTAHFNLAVLLNETKTNEVDAQKPEVTNLDTEPSTSTADEETYVKIPSWHNTANHDPKKTHPTGAVVPTCRRDYKLVNGIPAGYETDDSWDHDSLTHEREHTPPHTHNIVPLLTLCTSSNHPNRGREQPHRQNNNINMRSGNAPYPRPWDNQPYRRCTRSQQALRARAYRKLQCRYPISRLLHRCCASLDLEVAFKQIKISQDTKPELCTECRTEKCKCPAFTPGMPHSSASSMPTNISSDHKEIPDLVENKLLHLLYPPVQSPSDEEADQEVAAICRTPVYYRVRSQLTRRCRYYMYHALDPIEETSREKQQCANSPHVQGQPIKQ